LFLIQATAAIFTHQ